ncbi:MAG: T9SS type A sorting domain-containing protein [Flavobacteriales bacterium]|nr:T9SS type A sorting domain-containing protein [Flavobacteriales bacterium]
MLRTIHLGLFILAASLTTSLYAQQTVTILNDTSSWGSAGCPLPISGQLQVSGNATNYNPAIDSIQVIFQWGDGKVDSGMAYLQGSGPTYYGWNLGMTHNYSVPGEYSPRIIAKAPNGIADTVVASSFVLSTTCTQIDGYFYFDENENCSKDGGELIAVNRTVYAKNSSGATIGITTTDSTGYFRIYLLPNQSGLTLHCSLFDVFDEELICPASGHHSFSSSSSQSLDFGVKPQSPGVKVVNRHAAFCGVAAPGDTGVISMYSLVHFNTTNDFMDTVSISLSDQVSYVSTVDGPTPDAIIDNTLYWYRNIPAFGGNPVIGWFIYRISTRTNTNAVLFSDAEFLLTSSLHSLDEDECDNSVTVRLKVDGPYDPNNKEVSPAGEGPTGLIDTSTVELTYTVNFQNTGTAPAKHVYILDTLPPELNLSSFELIGASHKVHASQGGDGVVRFDFRNINLPDSNSDKIGSHGSVIFKINLTEDLSIGTEIKNRVGIYFDYNAPVVTNYAINTLYDEPFVPETLDISVESNDVTCLESDNGKARVIILAGNPPYAYAWSNGATTKSINEAPAGTYTVTVTDNESQVLTAEAIVLENRLYPDPVVEEVSGTFSVQAWESYIYTMANVTGNTFEWDALGGEVLDAANNQAEILWYGGPTGTILVTQISEHGCKASRDTEVPILFVGQDELEISSLSIYPNPSSERIYLTAIPEGSNVSVTIYDLSGRQVAMQSIRSIDQSIHIGTLSAGPYMVRLTQDGEVLGTTLMVKE